MRFLVLIDAAHIGLVAEARLACKDKAGHDIVWRNLDGAEIDGGWDAVLLTPGANGIPASLLEDNFTVEVQPDNTHSSSPDHTPTGTDAIFLGAGADSYRLAIDALIAKEAAS